MATTLASVEASFSTEPHSLTAIDRESSSFPENNTVFEQPDADNLESDVTSAQKKKKKKKPKKSAATKAKEAAAKKAAEAEGRPPILCISRNKHWKYISSYHVRIQMSEPRDFL